MKNKLIIILAVMLALVLASNQVNASPAGKQLEKTPGAAANQAAERQSVGQTGKPNGKPENYKGTISAVDAGSITLTLKDETSIIIYFNEQTRIKIPSVKDATYEDLKPGMGAMVQARRAQDDSLIAKAVHLVPGKPARKHHVGIVTDYVAGVSITIQAKDELFYSFSINDETKLLPLERVGMLDIGARVTIISPRDVTGGEALAAGIVIHPAGGDE
jgi:hypothetical protein